MKKVGIVTINNSNYGNRLQNYALQEILAKLGVKPITIKNIGLMNKKTGKFNYFLRNIKHIYKKNDFLDKKEREKYFIEFNKNINFSRTTFNWFRLKKFKDFDYFITGSDQVWNPNFGRLTDFDLLTFVEPKKRISFSASFGVSKIPAKYQDKLRKALRYYKAISVREITGKEIIKNIVGRNDVTVLLDPTMLLDAEAWDKVSKKPCQLKTDKFILNYFLGDLSEKNMLEIDRVARKYQCEVINILDKNSPYYECGPSEFLYLEKHAFLICTDSFHASVFAILYGRPFLVFDREDNHVNMNSRLDTLLSIFKLDFRKYTGKISDEILHCDYTEVYKILENEREKSQKFLANALDLEDSEKNE